MQWLKKLFAGVFKTKVPEPLPYSSVSPHLAQSDIFGLHLVAPLADDEIRILRTETGQHGAHVFAGEQGHIFDYAHLIKWLKRHPEYRDKNFHVIRSIRELASGQSQSDVVREGERVVVG